ncbi:MAG: EF-hand domain-containing protein [Gemmataceae bacterium]
MSPLRSICSPLLWFLIVIVGIVGGETANAAPKKKGKGKPPPSSTQEEDPRVAQVKVDLEAAFRHWDVDKDGKISAQEMASQIRGPKAVPYKAPSPGEVAAKGTSARAPSLEKLKLTHPDYFFMKQWDKDNDDFVSESEFKEFVSLAASHQKALIEKMDQVERLNQRLAFKNINARQKAQITAELRVLNANLGAAREGFTHRLILERMMFSRMAPRLR